MGRTCLLGVQVRTDKMVKTSSVWLCRNLLIKMIIPFLSLHSQFAECHNKNIDFFFFLILSFCLKLQSFVVLGVLFVCFCGVCF